MPLGWERLKAKTSCPNKNIVFIKPRSGATEATAKDYLERIAAQCLPIMNKHHLAVVSLEEYEPNTEFWGRNFNNGEVIQLVLRSPRTGHWLPFRFVQMVLMHELAHVHQMNHSKAFWALRNEYSADMKILWDRGYTGEGLWGRGVLLDNGEFPQETLEVGELLPVHMCGGTFRARAGKKRKMKPKVTYKEREERRIKKKFGTNGMALGADDEVKASLEKGKKPAGKPRVAQSQRGRELRAAAALARSDIAKREEPQIKDEEMVTDDETESGSDCEVPTKKEPGDAFDITGERLLDRKGHGMVRVCGEEDEANSEAQRELQELRGISAPVSPGQVDTPASKPGGYSSFDRHTGPAQKPSIPTNTKSHGQPAPEPEVLSCIKSQVIIAQNSASASKVKDTVQSAPPVTTHLQPQDLMQPEEIQPAHQPPTTSNTGGNVYTIQAASSCETTCSICSVDNDPQALTCCVCANVLKPDFVVGSWRCQSQTCKEGSYINAGDVNLCGVCGIRKRSMVS